MRLKGKTAAITGADADSVSVAFTEIEKEFGRLDVLYNNASWPRFNRPGIPGFTNATSPKFPELLSGRCCLWYMHQGRKITL